MESAGAENAASLVWGAIAKGVDRASAKQRGATRRAAQPRSSGMSTSASLPSLTRRSSSMHKEIGLFAFGAVDMSGGTVRLAPGADGRRMSTSLGKVNEDAYFHGPLRESPLLQRLKGVGSLHDASLFPGESVASAPAGLERARSASGDRYDERSARSGGGSSHRSGGGSDHSTKSSSSRYLGGGAGGRGFLARSAPGSTSKLDRLSSSARNFGGADEVGAPSQQNIFESDTAKLAVLRRAQILSRRAMELKIRCTERQARCRDNRDDKAKMERLRLLAVLEERRTRSARIEAIAQGNLRRSLWLAMVANGSFAAAQRKSLTSKRTARNVAKWQHASAAVMQNMYRARLARAIWHRFAHYARLMKRQRIRMCLAVRCFKRWHAMNVVNDFLLMYAHDASKLQILVMRFTTRVYYCQELARRWLAIQRARLHCLTVAWQAAEAAALDDERRSVDEWVAAARDEIQTKLDRMGRLGRGAAEEDDAPPPVPLSPRAAREKRREKRKAKKDASHTHARILAESEQFMTKCKFKDACLQELLNHHKAKYDEACEVRVPIKVLTERVEHALRQRLADGARPSTAPAALADGAPSAGASARKKTSRDAFMLGHSVTRNTMYGRTGMKEPEYLPKVASATRAHLLTSLLLRRKNAFFRTSTGASKKAADKLRASLEDQNSSSSEGDKSDGESDDEVFAVAHSGGFSAGDARKWLKIDRPDAQRAAGSPTPGPTADSSAMLMSNTRNRYMFFASFGGAAGMRAAVKAAMLAERARMAAIQEAICGPLEVHL